MSGEKTLAEIIDAVRDGQRPDYEDLRYAICAMEALSGFDIRALLNLGMAETEGKKPFLTTSAEWQFKECTGRRQRALLRPPKEFVGWENDPDNLDFLVRRKQSQALFDKIAARVAAKVAAKKVSS